MTAILVGGAWFARVGKGKRFAAILGVPTLFVTAVLYTATAMQDAHLKLPLTLQAPMVWAGGIYLFAIALLVILSLDDHPWRSRLKCAAAAISIAAATALSGVLIALLVLAHNRFRHRLLLYKCAQAAGVHVGPLNAGRALWREAEMVRQPVVLVAGGRHHIRDHICSLLVGILQRAGVIAMIFVGMVYVDREGAPDNMRQPATIGGQTRPKNSENMIEQTPIG